MTASASKLAILGGKPVGPVRNPEYPRFSKRAIRRATSLLEAGPSMGLTRRVREIRNAEAAISRYHANRHALAMSSGFASLHAALIGLEIAPGDEVITTPYSWGASTSCILAQQAIPVFADVNAETGLLDPISVEAAITPRSRAILVVHIYGQPANMTRLRSVADKHGLALIEDASQAHGARWQGSVVGNFGDAAGFSCMGGKLLATGEAGYLVTPSEDVYWRACLCTQHMGRAEDSGYPDALRPYVDSLQFTYRVSTLMAVLLEEQLKKLDREVNARRANVALFRQHLDGSKLVRLPRYPKASEPSFHMMTMTFDEREAGISRDTFIQAVRAEGLPLFRYIPAPIPSWRRMNWRGYDGPAAPWIDALRRARTDYRDLSLPGCERKIARSLEINFNQIRPAAAQMRRAAEIVHKVESQIDALRAYEKK